MKLWLLKANDEAPRSDAYDVYLGFVIRAETEEDARQMACDMSGDEKRYVPESVWKSRQSTGTEYVTCEELLPDGDEEIILSDFRAG